MRKTRRAKRERDAKTAERERLRAKKAKRPRPKGSWGGRRQGAGRPRLYATNAERQAAYRNRLRQQRE